MAGIPWRAFHELPMVSIMSMVWDAHNGALLGMTIDMPWTTHKKGVGHLALISLYTETAAITYFIFWCIYC